MAFEWTDRVDGKDYVLAEDVNSLANGIIGNERAITDNSDDIKALSDRMDAYEQQGGAGDEKGKNEIVIAPRRYIIGDDYSNDKTLKRADYILTPDDGEANVSIINEAIQKLKHLDSSTGGEIVFMGGRAPIAGTITIDCDNVKLSGNGIEFVDSPEQAAPIFNVSGNRVTIDDVYFNYSQDPNTSTYEVLFRISGGFFTLSNSKLFADHGFHTDFLVLDGSYAKLINSSILTYGRCLKINGNYCSVIGCTIKGYQQNKLYGKYFLATGNTFEVTDIESCFECGPTGQKTYANFTGNTFIDTGYNEYSHFSLLVVASDKNTIVGNTFFSNADVPPVLLRIYGNENVYAGNNVNAVEDTGENNTTYITKNELPNFENTTPVIYANSDDGVTYFAQNLPDSFPEPFIGLTLTFIPNRNSDDEVGVRALSLKNKTLELQYHDMQGNWRGAARHLTANKPYIIQCIDEFAFAVLDTSTLAGYATEAYVKNEINAAIGTALEGDY